MTEVLLKELSRHDIDWMVNAGRCHTIAPETVLVQQETSADALHILLDGTLAVTIVQNNRNPLNRAFAALEGEESFTREVARLSSGEVVGDIPCIGTSLTTTSVKAIERSLVLSIPQQVLAAKLQQDVGFAARFYRAVAILLSDRLYGLVRQLGRSTLVQGQPLRDVLYLLSELHDSDIDWMMAIGKRQRIKANTILIREGGPVDALYILFDGTMSLLIAEDDRNPLARAFAALEEEENLGREIARLSRGEIVGESPFVDARLPAMTAKVLEEAIVLSISRQPMAAKLQQDPGFASRFYQVTATLAANRLQGILSHFGYGRRAYSQGQPLHETADYADEVNVSFLDRIAFASARFDWMLGQMQDVAV